MPGPAPKKESERRRRNKDAVPTEVINLDEVLAGEIEVPETPEDWHATAQYMFDAFKRSGQAIWMEPTDWATAYMLCETLDRWLKPQEIKVGQVGNENAGHDVTYVFEEKIIAMPGATLNSILKGLSNLMATEGDRRRLKIELERAKVAAAAAGGDGKVVSISQRREDAWGESS